MTEIRKLSPTPPVTTNGERNWGGAPQAPGPRFIVTASAARAGTLWVSLLVTACGSATSGPTPVGVEVQVGSVTRATVRAYVHTYGTVEPAPADARTDPAGAAVASQIEGVIARSYCSEGRRVAAGELLFELDARSTVAAAAAAEVALDYARQTLARQQALIEFEGTSERLLQEAQRAAEAAEVRLEQARTALELLQIRAPLSGTIVRVRARPGESVRRDTVLAEIVDLDRLVIRVQVPLDQVDEVHVGQAATVFTGRYEPNATPAMESEVGFVGAVADQRTGTILVRVAVPRGSALAPGALVDVRITIVEHPDRLVVPLESIVTLEGRTTIARVDGTTAFRLPVTVVLVDGQVAEVSGPGLSEGMTIVTAGAYGLPDGATIRTQGPAATR